MGDQMTDTIDNFKQFIRPLIPVGLLEYVNRRQYLREAERGMRNRRTGNRAASLDLADGQRPTALVLFWSHEVGAVEGLAEVLSNSLALLQFHVTKVNIVSPSNLDAIAKADRKFDIAISVGAPPLAARIGGRPLFELFGKVFFLWGLDSIINDLARVYATREYWDAARRSTRLRFLFPDQDYCRIVGRAFIPGQVLYFPFGGYYDPLPPDDFSINRASRLAIIGTIGSELADVKEPTLGAIIDSDTSSQLSKQQRHELIAAIELTGGPTNTTAVAEAVLGLDIERLFSKNFLPLLTKIDAYEKRRRRILVVEKLSGLPVDFYGTGWDKLFGGGGSFRFCGPVHFSAISRLLRGYSGVVNFDPNWDGGVHDRVYTALGNGCKVLTNASSALSDISRPEGTVFTYDANCPDVRDASESILTAPSMPIPEIERFRRDNCWPTRIDAFLRKID
jgi:hypothetical protein